ncbi:sensor histidine kinase [Streptomyces lincolnensis]|uniref:histidine kinase n=1 Tax=Streptomyces lincolnensis TaxID=1915 RepID=A0A1B1MAX3_STRLN|nr:ATP-binding protein [Streptomyces lincolnensis]ANS65786.1 sensor histidine kinase [Streptomyces lincolnensis]AXG54451.1 sensor histidine kinase [Streptomyces lincolnensis]QMV08823.1 ATP-binding protein [Streptomyces lincolnensis]
MTSFIKDPLVWILLIVIIAAAFAVMGARRTNMALRRNNDNLQSNLVAVQGQLRQVQSGYESLTARHVEDLAEVRADAESATKSVLKSAMGTLQSLAEEQQVLLDNLQKGYGDNSGVLADLMLIDHTSSQFSRRTKGISVLCGGWLGRREESASVYDVARSAQGRIKDFNRVRVHAQVNISITGKAVEPVAVVLAELLDNATKYSAPQSPVEINIQAVPTGVCLVVDDAGVGMSQETKARAAALLSPEGVVDITGLGDPPRFGFAVCGMLAARYGFSVSVDSVSPYGGVRAVIRVPEGLLTTEAPQPAASHDDHEYEEDVAARPRAAVPAPGPTLVVGTTTGGLPRRRRRNRAVSVVPEPELEQQQAAPSGADAENSEVTASRIGAFARGTHLGRVSNNTEGSQNQ